MSQPDSGNFSSIHKVMPFPVGNKRVPIDSNNQLHIRAEDTHAVLIAQSPINNMPNVMLELDLLAITKI